MAKTNLITGLDIGTENIKVLVAKKDFEQDKIEIVAQISKNSAGLRRGVVISLEKTAVILKDILSDAAEEAGQKIDAVYVNVDGAHLFSLSSHGTIAVSRADQRISEEDVQRVVLAAQTFSLSSNKEIFETQPKEYIVDGEKGIKESVGLKGVRLETEVLVLGGFSLYLNNLEQAVLGAGVEKIFDIIPSPIAAAKACLTEKQKELGSAVLDIGAGTTGLAVFEEGNLVHLKILPMGSGNITSDIAIGLKTEIEVAERVKKDYGSCEKKRGSKKIRLDLDQEKPLIFSLPFLQNIIKTRVIEIFKEVNKELKKIDKEKKLPAGIVLTGNGAKLPGIVDLCKKELGLPVRLGRIQDVDFSFITAWGLILQGFSSQEQDFSKSRALGFAKDVGARLKKMFKIFIP